MILPRYEYIDERVKDFRKEFKITTPRVDVSEVCKSQGWKVIPSTIVKGSCEAITYDYKGYYLICLPEELRYWCRVKWSLGHEFSHVYLNHFKEFKLSPVHAFVVGDKLIDDLDSEANHFTAEILMDRRFIYQNYKRGSEYLRRAFGVSKQAIHNRLDNLGLLGIVEAAATKESNNDGPQKGPLII